MKTIYKKKRSILFLIISIISITSLAAVNSSRVITINGVVKDQKSKKTIEYATVSVPGTNIGTMANTDGEFTLKIYDSLQVKEIEVSHIGYANYRHPVSRQNVENVVILLTSNSNQLKEVVVKMIDPYQLVLAASENIQNNYSEHPNLLTGFYRETIKKRRNYINISEAVIDIYKTAYNDLNGVNLDRIQIYKGRQLMSIKPSDTLAVKFQGGPTLSVYADLVKNKDMLLSLENLSYYKFSMEDPVMIDERTHYVVSFVPQVILPYALYEGKLFIDKESYTFSRAEFRLNMDDRSKVTQAILKKKPFRLQFKPEEVAFLITYNQRNGRSSLNYIRSEVRFKCDWKKKWIFSTGYTVVSEMVVTDIEEGDVNKISRKFMFKENDFLSDQVENFYDEDFWGNYNIIEPTESLESAVGKLIKQHR